MNSNVGTNGSTDHLVHGSMLPRSKMLLDDTR